MNGRNCIYMKSFSRVSNTTLAAVLTPKVSVHKEYIVSAKTEKGPVTPNMVSGWFENLKASEMEIAFSQTYTASIMQTLKACAKKGAR